MKILKIGLTGGVGSGKTTVSDMFSSKGVPVFDADIIAKELMEPGQPALAEVVEQFGDSVLSQGRLNRPLLRDKIYADAAARHILEAILHPRVYQVLAERAACVRESYCIFAVPLLIETAKQDFVDRILVVDCPVELQFERARQRDGLDDVAISRILAAQASRRQRLAVANDIIDNSGSLSQLREQVDRLHECYLAQARAWGRNPGDFRAID